jgi:NADPH:quinone reductase-like Zn-dependent oxidoreductase
MPLRTTTRRWASDLSSGYKGLEYQIEAPIPSLLPYRVLIKIKAVSLRYRDLDAITGCYYNSFRKHGKTPLPLVPCSDRVGVIIAVGSDVGEDTGVAVGDEVLCLYNTEHICLVL